jgi:hypothetical protein
MEMKQQHPQFPPMNTPFALGNFTYIMSNRPARQGELVIFQYLDQSGEADQQPELMWLFGVVQIEHTEGCITARSSDIIIFLEPGEYKRLIFTIPIDLSQPSFSN